MSSVGLFQSISISLVFVGVQGQVFFTEEVTRKVTPKISIFGHNRNFRLDSSTNRFLQILPPGHHRLEVSARGCITQRKKIKVEGMEVRLILFSISPGWHIHLSSAMADPNLTISTTVLCFLNCYLWNIGAIQGLHNQGVQVPHCNILCYVIMSVYEVKLWAFINKAQTLRY